MRKFLVNTIVLSILLCFTVSTIANENKCPQTVEEYLSTDTIEPLGDIIPVIIDKVPKDYMRTLAPISAIYNKGILELDFETNLGTVYVVVTNNTTYERWSDYIDTSLGNISFDLYTQNPYGYYNVMIYTDNNGNFGGDFIVQ